MPNSQIKSLTIDGVTYDIVDKTSGYITSYTETDPIFSASVAAGITSTDISNWNNKVKKSGDRMSGDLTFNEGKGIAFDCDEVTPILKGYGYVVGDTGNYIGTIQFSSKTQVTNLQVPSNSISTNSDVVNKKYVDDSVATRINTAGTGLSKSGTTLNHSNSVTAQTTQAVYPIKIDAQGHISAYGNAVTIPTVPSNIVNTVTTTAGAHTTISSQNGNVSFNVPTKTSHLTNDSGFITSYTDEKVKIVPTTALAKFFLVGSQQGSSTETTTLLKHDSICVDLSANNSSFGYSRLSLGNEETLQADDARQGVLLLYGTTAYNVQLKAGAPTGDRVITFPNKTGTIALTSDVGTIITLKRW